MRKSGRKNNELREIKVTRNYTKYAEGSVLIEFGDTRVLCNASVANEVPPFLKNQGTGWVTAEYAMLPRATNVRTQRDGARGKTNGRSQEIQRLIGRVLRGVTDLKKIGEKTVTIDADVIQADGGTRTAAITGSYIALHDAFEKMIKKENIKENPLKNYVAAVSVGIVKGEEMLDLDYSEDSAADVDMNVVMTDKDEYVEIQATGEKQTFSDEQLKKLFALAKKGIKQLIKIQKKAIKV